MNYRPIVFGLHGQPSSGKTTTVLTGGNVLLLDFDMGADRAGIATDAYPIYSWEDAVSMLDSEQFANCDAIGLDTVKTCLDNYLADFVMKNDYKNKRGNVLSLAGYGALGNEFKTWLARIRRAGKDVIWVAHSKDEKDGDEIASTPNITGGSYDLLMQCTDQCGYMSTQQGKRVIKFAINEKYRSKDSAYLGQVSIPAINHATHSLFLYELMDKVKQSLADRSKKAASRGDVWSAIKRDVLSAKDAESLTVVMTSITSRKGLGEPDKMYARQQIVTRARDLQLKYNKDAGAYEPIGKVVETEPVAA